MPINPSIAMGVKPIEFQDPLVAYGRVAQLQQAQQQNELAKMQMAEYERTRQEEEGVRNYLRGADITKPETQSGLLGYGKTGLSTLKSVQESQASQLKAKIDALKYHNDLATQSAQILGSVTDQPSWDAARTKLASLGGDANALPLAYDPNFVKSEMTSALSVKDQIERSTPKHLLKDVGGQVIAIQDNPNLPGYGQPIEGVAPIVKTATPGELLSNQIARGQLDVSRGQLGVAQGRLGVEQENARRASDPVFQQRMAAAKATGEAAAKGDVAAIQAMPNVLSRAEEGVRLIDELIGKRDTSTGKLLKGEKPHPGFEGSVGATLTPGARFIPGTDASGFMARFDQIKGASFLEAFESLRGGGSITETEGTKGTSAINRMSTATSEKEFVRAAMDLQDVIRKGVTRAQAKVNRATGASPAAPTSPNIDALLDKYK